MAWGTQFSVNYLLRFLAKYQLASHAGVFRGARLSSLPHKRTPLKTPAWDAKYQLTTVFLAIIS